MVFAHPVLEELHGGIGRCVVRLGTIAHQVVICVADPERGRSVTRIPRHPRLQGIDGVLRALLRSRFHATGDLHAVVGEEIEGKVVVTATATPDDHARRAIGHYGVQQPDRASVHDLLLLKLGGRVGVDGLAVLIEDLEDDDGVQFTRAGDTNVASGEIVTLANGAVVVRLLIDCRALEVLEFYRPGVVGHADHHAHVRNRGIHVGHIDRADVRATGCDRGAVVHVGVGAEGRVKVLIERRDAQFFGHRNDIVDAALLGRAKSAHVLGTAKRRPRGDEAFTATAGPRVDDFGAFDF